MKGSRSFSFFGLLLFFSVSCTKSTSSKISFLIHNPTQKISVRTSASDNEYGVAAEKTFRFKTCFIDRENFKPLSKEFSIQRNNQNLVIDPQGCVEWEDQIAFNYFAPENLILKKYKFETELGNPEVELLVNPWDETAIDRLTPSEAKFIDGEESDEALKGVGKYHPQFFTPEIRTNLIVDRIEGEYYDGVHSKSKMQLGWNLSASPYGIRQGIGNRIKKLEISKGEFQVKFALAECDSNHCEIQSESKPQKWQLEDVKLQGHVDFEIEKLIQNSQSPLYLLYEFLPTGADNKLLPSKGKCEISESKKLNCHPSPISLNERLSLPNGPKNNNLTRQLGFEIYDWDVRFKRSLPFNTKTLESSIQVEVKACVRNSFTQKNAAYNSFRASLVKDISFHDIESNAVFGEAQTGCLKWVQTISYSKYQMRRDYIPYTIVVQGMDSPFQNIQQVRNVHLYPWAQNESLFWNTEKDGTPVIKFISTSEQDAAALTMDEKNQFTLYSQSPDYEVDTLMQLRELHRFHIKFAPKILIKNSKNKGNYFEDIEEGTPIKIRGIIGDPKSLKTWNRETDYLTDFEISTTVKGNKMIDEEITIPLDFLDSPRLQTKLQLFLEVSLDHPNTTLKPLQVLSDFYIQFNNPNAVSNTIAVEKNFEDLLPQKLTRTKHLESPKNFYHVKERFNQKSGLKLFLSFWKNYYDIQYSEVSSLPVTQLSPTSLNENATTLAKSFCEPLKNKKTDLDSCLNFPLQFFTASVFQLIDDSKNPDVFIKRRPPEKSILIADQTFNEQTESKRANFGDKNTEEYIPWQISQRLGYDNYGTQFIPWHSSYTFKSEQYDVVESVAVVDKKKRSGSGEQLQLRVEGVELEFKSQVRNCLFVKPNLIVQTIYPALKSQLLCTKPGLQDSLKETWYQIHDKFQPSQTVLYNQQSNDFLSLTKLIRGEKAYNEFKNTVFGSVLNFNIKQKLKPNAIGVENIAKHAIDMKNPKDISNLFADGSVFAGLLNYESGSNYFWNETQVFNKTQSCVKGKESDSIKKGIVFNKTKYQKYCFCLYDSMAQRILYQDLDNQDKYNSVLNLMKTDGTWNRCEAYAKKS